MRLPVKSTGEEGFQSVFKDAPEKQAFFQKTIPPPQLLLARSSVKHILLGMYQFYPGPVLSGGGRPMMRAYGPAQPNEIGGANLGLNGTGFTKGLAELLGFRCECVFIQDGMRNTS